MKHAISTRYLGCLNLVCGHFLIIYGACMNILFIIKVKILVLIKWLCRYPSIMLTIEPRMGIIFWACCPIYYIQVFNISVFQAMPNHVVVLKYRCPNKNKGCLPWTWRYDKCITHLVEIVLVHKCREYGFERSKVYKNNFIILHKLLGTMYNISIILLQPHEFLFMQST